MADTTTEGQSHIGDGEKSEKVKEIFKITDSKDALNEDEECLICGEPMGFVDRKSGENASGTDKCVHVICVQCKDDYILTDPDNKHKVLCPLCVQENNS